MTRRIMRVLAAHGVSTIGGPGSGAMRAWVRMRGADAGELLTDGKIKGFLSGALCQAEVFFTDPDGILVRLRSWRA